MTKKQIFPGNVLILIPTYNESDNVQRIYFQIRHLYNNFHVLFIDDNSPDGTGKIIDKLIKADTKIHVLHRKRKMGIGSAHLQGIQWAYQHHFKNLLTMDCDFSHSPKYIKKFLYYGKNYDIVIGSRYLKRDSLNGWNWYRKVLTKLGHLLTKYLLRIPYDASGAYRLYRLDKINKKYFNLITAKSYSFFFESLLILKLNKYSIKEFSIVLPPRTYGHSKMTLIDAVMSLKRLINDFFIILTNRKTFLDINDSFDTRKKNLTKNQNEWDLYWIAKEKTSGHIYDFIADFYRKFIIKGALNYFIKKHFTVNAKVLHAGCGSGQVDTDIAKFIKIVALDSSREALKLYKQNIKKYYQTTYGDIRALPLTDNSFDGIYNLGVLEHFNKNEINKILKEFYRVLKPGGKIIIFWPPKFGPSVIFLNSIHYLINNILQKKIRLHPMEISLLNSQQEAVKIFKIHGFKIKEIYFGPKDLFTYIVIVGEK